MNKYIFQPAYLPLQTLSKKGVTTTFLVQRATTSQYYICKHFDTRKFNKRNREELLREILIVSNLKHHNIIQLEQHFESTQEIAVVMEYCEEGDLGFHLRQQERKGVPFKKEVVEQWVFQILLVLDYLHTDNIILGNLLERSVFLTKKGNIKIRVFRFQVTDHNQVLSPLLHPKQFLYTSPQSIKSNIQNIKTNIWALGVLIYRICMLRYPFQSIQLGTALLKIAKNDAPQIPSSYSPFLSKLVKGCLRKNPESRPTAFGLLKQPYFMKIMEVFVKNDGVILESVEIKKHQTHRTKMEEKRQRIKSKEEKQGSQLRPKEEQEGKSAIIRKKSLSKKQTVSKEKEKEKEGGREKQKDGAKEKEKDKDKEKSEMIKLPSISRQPSRQHFKQKDRKPLRPLSSEARQQKKPIITTDRVGEDKQAKQYPKKLETKPSNSILTTRSRSRNKSKSESGSIERKKQVGDKQLTPILNPKPNNPPLRPNIPISPYKKQKEREKKILEAKAKTEESKIEQEKPIDWLQEQLIDYSLTKTGKFHHQFDFLRKPPAIQSSRSQQQMDMDIEEYCRLTSANEENSMIQTYKSRMEEVSKDILQKYEPRMESIQERTFEFGSDEFTKFPGNYQNSTPQP